MAPLQPSSPPPASRYDRAVVSDLASTVASAFLTPGQGRAPQKKVAHGLLGMLRKRL